MHAMARRKRQADVTVDIQPNDVDRKRIERAITGRVRYRYVTPTVIAVDDGYRIESPCCSRNIDKAGGRIDIAWLEYLPPRRGWRLYRKDHTAQQWVYYDEFATLKLLLEELNQDTERLFWQ